MKESNATENLINLLEQVKAAITEEDLQQARLSLLDYLGVTLGGEGKMAVFLGDNGDNNELLSIAEKAFKNGFYGHYLELVDGDMPPLCRRTGIGGRCFARWVSENISHDSPFHVSREGIFVCLV